MRGKRERERGKTLNNDGDTRGTMGFRGDILTRNKQCQHLWGTDRSTQCQPPTEKEPFSSRPVTLKKKGGYSVVLWARERDLLAVPPFQPQFRRSGGVGGSHFCLAQRASKAQRATGLFFARGPGSFGRVKRLLSYTSSGETHQSRRGAWLGLRERRVAVAGERRGMNTVTWGAACGGGGGGLTQAQTRGSVLDSHGPSGRNTVPLPSFLPCSPFFFLF